MDLRLQRRRRRPAPGQSTSWSAGRDLLDATADQIRLGRLLGRETPPAFAHHPLILRADGSKLSKADGATGIRELRAAGWTADRVIAEATAAIGFEP